MKKMLPRTERKHLVIYIIVTVISVILAAVTGYYLAARYRDTITDTYHTAVSSISQKLTDVQSDVADEISKLEESVSDDKSE